MTTRLISRNILLLIILLVLLVLVMVVRHGSPFGRGQTDFAADPSKEITAVEFTEAGNRIVLRKEGDDWKVNGKSDARKSGITFLLQVLTRMKIKSPVSPALFSEEITERGVNPVHVRVFGGRRMISSYFVYKTGSNKYGNIMKIRPGSKPFIVYVPGFEGDIGSAYTMNELFWLPYTIFNLLPSEISSIRFENYSDPAASFLISYNDRTYTLSDSKSLLSGWDTSRVKRFISYFTRIPFEDWALDMPDNLRDSIISVKPAFRITVSNSNGQKRMLTLWDRYADGTGLKDNNRAWGRLDTIDRLFVVRYFDIDPVIKKLSYFFSQ